MIDFVRNLFRAAIEHTPGPFFSTGGDEINALCYAVDDVVQGTLNKTGQTLEQALDTFTQKTHAVVLESGKTPVVWQEMVLRHQVKLDPKTVVLWVSIPSPGGKIRWLDGDTDPWGSVGYGFQVRMQRLLQRPDLGLCMPQVIISTSIVELVDGSVITLTATRGATHTRPGRR